MPYAATFLNVLLTLTIRHFKNYNHVIYKYWQFCLFLSIPASLYLLHLSMPLCVCMHACIYVHMYVCIGEHGTHVAIRGQLGMWIPGTELSLSIDSWPLPPLSHLTAPSRPF